MVKNIPNLYVFLKNHMMNNIRANSRNKGRDGQGAIQFLEPIEAFVDNNLFTEGQAQIIKTLAETLESFYLEGSDIGNKSAPARDPAFIVFTEQEKTGTGQKEKTKKRLQGIMQQNGMLIKIILMLLLKHGLHTLMPPMALMEEIHHTKHYSQEPRRSSLIPKVCFG